MQEILDDQFLKEKPKEQEKNKWFYLFLTLLLVGAVVSSVTAWVEVENIIYSGPIMSGIGIPVLLFAIKFKSKKIAVLGLLPVTTSIFWLITTRLVRLLVNERS